MVSVEVDDRVVRALLVRGLASDRQSRSRADLGTILSEMVSEWAGRAMENNP